LKNRDKIIFKLIEKNTFDELKDIKIVLYFLNQYSKAYFKRQTGIDSIRFGSIFLFINGFRIPPFGDFGNDWLGLELRKGQGRARFMGARDLIGRVEINDKENKFKIISNREGLVKNSAHNFLVGNTRDEFTNSFFYAIFRKLEMFVVDGLDWDRIKKIPKTEDNIEEEEKSEIKNYMKEFHEKVNSSTWKYDPSIEKYAETQAVKDVRIIKQIYKIVTVTTYSDNIIDLYINDELIKQLATENVEKMEVLLTGIEEFDKDKLDLKTSKGVEKIKTIIRELSIKAKKEEEKRATAELKAKKESEKRLTVEKELDKTKDELKDTQTQNIFLKSTGLQDKDQIVSLFHYIGIRSDTIQRNIKHCFEELDRKENVNLAKIHEYLEDANYCNNELSVLAKIGYKGGITKEMENEKQDIIEFILEFLENICKKYYTQLKFNYTNYTNQNGAKLVKEFKPFEIIYLIDNFISNSKKAHATEINFYVRDTKNAVIVEIDDNGDGLDKKASDPQKIFEKNISYTGGSGLGLYDAKNIIEKLGGKIYASNKNGRLRITMEINK
jgi:hypothetical protein